MCVKEKFGRAEQWMDFSVFFDNGSYKVIVQADEYETLHQEVLSGNEPPCTLVFKSISSVLDESFCAKTVILPASLQEWREEQNKVEAGVSHHEF